jgi:aryl-alcohol dehydrogenase-like predicted oxidoreductase
MSARLRGCSAFRADIELRPVAPHVAIQSQPIDRCLGSPKALDYPNQTEAESSHSRRVGIDEGTVRLMIERMAFGATGHESSRVLFGAAALGGMRQEKADQLLALLLEYGVNHIDTAASYGDSELRLAPWLAEHRAKFFLATKTGERRGDAARAELERSLERMGVDHVDLIQLHNLVEPEEWDIAHGKGGAVEAMAQARDEGLVKHIGVTGHGLRIAGMHQRSLDAFPFDSVLFPYSAVLLQDPGYRSDVENLLTTCADRQVAVQTIKSIARRRWADHDGPRFSWYEPLRDRAAVQTCVDWVLSDSQVFLNSTSDASVLPLVLAAAAASSGEPPTDEAMQATIDEFNVRPIFDGAALERI